MTDLAKLAERLEAAGHDERLSTGALYLEAARILSALAQSEKAAGVTVEWIDSCRPETGDGATFVGLCRDQEQLCNAALAGIAAIAERDAALAEVARLEKDPSSVLSDHPGCVYCMQAGTTVKDGEVCPQCRDRLPTSRERQYMRARDAANALLREASAKLWEAGDPGSISDAIDAHLNGKG